MLESIELSERQKQPVWGGDFILAGFTAQGRQIRIRWFPHFRFD